MKSRLIILALGLSKPGTMGGNSKITLETARRLSTESEVHFIVPTEKLPTLTQNIRESDSIQVHTIENFSGDDKLHPFSSCRWFLPRVRNILRSIEIKNTDFLFSCSDFHVDVIPAYLLQKEFGFRWIASLFLFVPFITENLTREYRFPPFKYLIYWFYQRVLFAFMKSRATGFVITNSSDATHFPARFKDRLFAFYGGVNIEQIPTGALAKKRDVVFCSRLHPQKGIDGFLDVWALVLAEIPSARLTIIGNGESLYETHLKQKADRLSIANSIEWLGYVNNEAKFAIYAESRIFVHPTVFDNNGMVAAEALATGLPVVMQDLPALRTIYTTGCVKVPFGDRHAYASAIIKLLSDSVAYAKIAPSTEQIDALRKQWCWATRVHEFKSFLDRIEKIR